MTRVAPDRTAVGVSNVFTFALTSGPPTTGPDPTRTSSRNPGTTGLEVVADIQPRARLASIGESATLVRGVAALRFRDDFGRERR
jgi:hypothetical protein